MCVQYIRGCSLYGGGCTDIGGYHEYIRDTISTLRGVQYIGGYDEYIRGCSIHWGDTMSTSRGYHEYIKGIS